MWRSCFSRRRAAEQSFVEAYVALDRVKRQADGQRRSFERWLERVALAEQLDKHDLAAAARKRALRAASVEIELRRISAQMEQTVERLRLLASDS